MFSWDQGLKASFTCLSVLALSANVLPARAETARRSPSFVEKAAVTETTVTEATVTESAHAPASESISEALAEPPLTNRAAAAAAMAEIMEALHVDGVDMAAPTIEATDSGSLELDTAGLDIAEPAAESAIVEVGQKPGAEVLLGLEGLSLNHQIPIETTDIDWVATSAAFTVNSNSVPALRAALGSDNPLTQLYAADALWMLTGDRDLVLPTLMEAAVSGDADAQNLAIAAIAQMGEDALPAVPLLNDLVGDRNSRTQQIAADALAIINSKDRPSTLLGIITRESRRILLPTAIRVINDLF